MFISLPLLGFICTLAALMWGSGVWLAVRLNKQARQREEFEKLLRRVATVVLGPVDVDGARNNGLEDQFVAHVRHDHEKLQTYMRVFAKKFARIWKAFRWGSDDMIVALQVELNAVEDEMSETGRHRALNNPHNLPPPVQVRKRFSPAAPIPRSDDEEDKS